jgi:hypothetical protein
VRELFEGGRRCIEEHWWRPATVPSTLLPGEGEHSPLLRAVRATQGDYSAAFFTADQSSPRAAQIARSLNGLLIALGVALRDERRQVISVAATFREVPADQEAGAVLVRSDAEGRLRLEVVGPDGTQMLRAGIWFGCGSRSARYQDEAPSYYAAS